MITIRNRFNSETILSGEYDTLKDLIGANRRADLSVADLSGADLYRADLYRANLYRANLYRADLSWANLSGADLSGADLSGADLSWANLSGANISGANISGANLSGANISLPIITIVGSRHTFQYVSDNITIGCEFHSIEYWKIMYDVIGRENDYTEAEIEEYHRYIKMCDSVRTIPEAK
jgi:hypothetical protein